MKAILIKQIRKETPNSASLGAFNQVLSSGGSMSEARKAASEAANSINSDYNFKRFTNAKGEEMLQVFSPGILVKSNEELMSTPSHERAKLLFSISVDELRELSKSEVIEDYIVFEASIKGLDADKLYNQILKQVKRK